MIFCQTRLSGVFEIQIETKPDDRGFFVRCWYQREFEDAGLGTRLVRCSLSYNTRKATLRGILFAKGALSRAEGRSVYQWVDLGLRPASPTFSRLDCRDFNCRKKKHGLHP
jgi:dTDP-4-dehydrorhamnose 3,5-epimerase